MRGEPPRPGCTHRAKASTGSRVSLEDQPRSATATVRGQARGMKLVCAGPGDYNSAPSIIRMSKGAVPKAPRTASMYSDLRGRIAGEFSTGGFR